MTTVFSHQQLSAGKNFATVVPFITTCVVHADTVQLVTQNKPRILT